MRPKSQNYRNFRTGTSKQWDKTFRSILGLYSQSISAAANALLLQTLPFTRDFWFNFQKLYTKTQNPPRTGTQAGSKMQLNPAREKLKEKTVEVAFLPPGGRSTAVRCKAPNAGASTATHTAAG